jgi:hypothetical protein
MVASRSNELKPLHPQFSKRISWLKLRFVFKLSPMQAEACKQTKITRWLKLMDGKTFFNRMRW